MARLFTRSGDEICWLVDLAITGVNFTAEVVRYATRETNDEAILQTDGAHYRVIIDSWDVGVERGRQVARVRGRIAAKV
jgi:hypothetical protein